MKAPRLKRDWVGRHVRTKHELRNGFVTIPVGTVMEVRYNRAGLSLRGLACECCGVRPSITRVPEYDVDLLPEASE
jgi:hypothetical protein